MKNNFKNFMFCAALGVKMNDPGAWLDYSDNQMRGDKSRSEITMTVKTENWERNLEIKADINGTNEAFISIEAPAKEKGIRTLRIDKNMWNYFPKINRKVAVSSSMLLSSWMGSDFTNDDILKASSLSKDYSHTFLPDETIDNVTYKVIENKALADSKVIWPKIITYASKSDCLPRHYHYFNKSNELKRKLALDKIQKFDNKLVPTVWTMTPVDDPTKKTILIYNKINFKVEYPKNHFSFKNLTGN